MENHGKSVPVVRVGTGSLDEEPKKNEDSEPHYVAQNVKLTYLEFMQ